MRTLQELSDLEDIRDLRLNYTHFMDGGDLEALLDIYTDDAVCEFANFGHWEGKEAMREGRTPYVQKPPHIGPFGAGRHVVTNPQISIAGDTATGRWFLIDVVYREGPNREQMREHPIGLFGMYEDEYRRVDGAWKISKTTLHFYWPTFGAGPAQFERTT